MFPDLELLIELQSVDQEIARLSAEIAALPRHVAEIESRLNEHIRQLDAEKQTLAAHYKERKNCEQEIQILREKISKYKDQMLAVKTNEQYRALQHEIEYAEADIRKLEDRILEKMVLDDDLEAAVQRADVRLAEERTEVEKEKAAVAARTRQDEEELAARTARHNQIRSQISAEVFKAYRALLQSRKGLAVVAIQDGACSGCRVMLRPQHLNEARANDKLSYCEACRRILYFPAPAKVEALDTLA
jgi:predicted  nucleic acid-binding Zn-ribbon protein